ncbi:hypothetical protein OQ483_06300 [Enterobacter bugandensis]|uniref:hypothetical protein n=1 Tax=Enterobacter bugandensis TaxID=881260 RepID=UPI000A7BBD05|nr:hypothetical protein [Enterobacter bugandensis]EMC1017061.1 hypothetical protein [Enterobacter bugandensis]WMU74024.1 hypothetical protein OQ483_06300 [Enterobacter bugandensis]
MFDIPFNPVSAIPVLEVSEDESYIGEIFLSFDELSLLLKQTQVDFFNPDITVLIQLIFSVEASARMRLWLYRRNITTKQTWFHLFHLHFPKQKMVSFYPL